jgi:hypothetical protein
MVRSPLLATVGPKAFVCLVCAHDQFFDREVLLNTSGMTFLGWDWANASALGLVCARCSYVHEFAGSSVRLWQVDGGYPADVERTPAP